MVSPETAWSTAAWIDSPGCTTQVWLSPAAATPAGSAASSSAVDAVSVSARVGIGIRCIGPPLVRLVPQLWGGCDGRVRRHAWGGRDLIPRSRSGSDLSRGARPYLGRGGSVPRGHRDHPAGGATGRLPTCRGPSRPGREGRRVLRVQPVTVGAGR